MLKGIVRVFHCTPDLHAFFLPEALPSVSPGVGRGWAGGLTRPPFFIKKQIRQSDGMIAAGQRYGANATYK